MLESRTGRHILSSIAVVWLLSVLASYYYYNSGYYAEKLSTFLRFLGRAL